MRKSSNEGVTGIDEWGWVTNDENSQGFRTVTMVNYNKHGTVNTLTSVLMTFISAFMTTIILPIVNDC